MVLVCTAFGGSSSLLNRAVGLLRSCSCDVAMPGLPLSAGASLSEEEDGVCRAAVRTQLLTHAVQADMYVQVNAGLIDLDILFTGCHYFDSDL